jgi:hypothetical protein
MRRLVVDAQFTKKNFHGGGLVASESKEIGASVAVRL